MNHSLHKSFQVVNYVKLIIKKLCTLIFVNHFSSCFRIQKGQRRSVLDKQGLRQEILKYKSHGYQTSEFTPQKTNDRTE